MTAIESMQSELRKIKYAIAQLSDDNGTTRHIYRYKMLVSKARAFREAIVWMQSIYKDEEPRAYEDFY